MPVCYQLVGIPGSGKSTWIAKQEWAGDCAIISTDNHVEEFARQSGKTYSEVFKAFMPQAVSLMSADVIAARNAGRDIIWDQTSTTIGSRSRKFRMLPKYRHIAVIFKTPDTDELMRRLNNRPGKTIPRHVIDDMVANFEMPTLAEGFSDIWHA